MPRGVMVAGVVALIAASTATALAANNNGTPASKPPAITFTFPTNGGIYKATAWAAGCSPAGLCGQASDQNGVASVTIAILQQASGKYWNGSAFASSTAAYNSATGTTSWRYPFALPTDGKYTALVRATDGLGNATPANSPVQATFTIDTVAPPPPNIDQHPDPLTSSTTAVFHFADLAPTATFRCSLDGAPYGPCDANTTFTHLSLGDHCVTVYAVDPAQNASASVAFCFTVETRDFTVAGDPSQLFFLGNTQPVNLVITNPFAFDLRVDQVGITVQDATTKNGNPNPGCIGSQNLVVSQAFTGPVVVPKRATKSLQDLGVPQSQWPTLTLANRAVNQDACQNAVFSFTYSGLGTKA
jgi:hypothetical protein